MNARINFEQIQCSSQQINLVFSFIIFVRYLLTGNLLIKVQETYSCLEALSCCKSIARHNKGNTICDKFSVCCVNSLYVRFCLVKLKLFCFVCKVFLWSLINTLATLFVETINTHAEKVIVSHGQRFKFTLIYLTLSHVPQRLVNAS